MEKPVEAGPGRFAVVQAFKRDWSRIRLCPNAQAVSALSQPRRRGQRWFTLGSRGDAKVSLGKAVVLRGLLTNEEGAFFEPFVVEIGSSRGRLLGGHRRVLDAVSWVARTGVP